MIDFKSLVSDCKSGDANACRILYDLYKANLMGMCRRYARSREEAQDVLQESFIKIFSNIKQLESADKLEGWMKSIVVRTAIHYYHKTKSHELVFQYVSDHEKETLIHAMDDWHASDELIGEMVNALPEGCRIVFNLFVVEGYNHAEIAQMLQVSEGTSRSQLHRAKQLLQSKIKSQALADQYEKLA